MGAFQIDFGSERNSKIVGIDLGTTNSLVAYMDLTRPRIIEDAEGRKIVPSVISSTSDGKLIAGEPARDLLLTNPGRSIYSVKRLMGRGVADVHDELKLFPFRIADDSESVIKVKLGERTFTPPEISAAVLRQLKDNAEAALGVPVIEAVITVPAYFNDAQRQATKDAGRLAGLEVLRLVNEPTAASLAYGLDKRNNGIIAVYDFGGGTFDISILRLHEGIFEVLATNGDTHLGGDDIDNLLLRIALEDLESEWAEDLSRDSEGVQRLRRAVIKAKEELSFVPETRIEFEYKGRRYTRAIDRQLFDRLIAPIVERTLESCRACLNDAKLTPEGIDEVVLVGGSTRIPLVRTAVERLFKAKPHTELNPEEVVALGAAVQAGILAGHVEDKLLLDVTPLSLGIETMGGVVSKLIHRNSTIPASATETFTTAVDGQCNVLIHVLQGERELVKDCRSLARFDFKDVEPIPAGMARIEVRFLIDANGILNVTARDARTGKEQSVEVKPSYGLSEEQVEAMIRESFEKAEEDMRERQVREARVEADNILSATEKGQKSEAWMALTSEERAVIEFAIRDLEASYHGTDHHVLNEKIEQLNKATMKLAENMMNSAVQGALKGTKID
ncbi:MAG: Fe-S protein assembly chaperone HscA [Acidobacteriaceae bacterium]|nr:Fe-S protein assembly chaperone HscA [Acidobacteriaceae bacterium]MBV9780107.1 Fe-S protein assembly chaperone HscA [Acidobacteriaceae bacterium]